VVGGAAGVIAAGPLERLLGRGEAFAVPAFPLDDPTASRVLLEARSRGAGYADLYLEMRTVTRMNLADGAIESVEQGIFAGSGVRAVDGDRTGYAYADSFEEGPLLDAARNAAAIATTPSGNLQPISFKVGRAPRGDLPAPFRRRDARRAMGWVRQIDRTRDTTQPSSR
jgi:TldD protein